MTENNDLEDKINKLIALSSTQSVIITELANAVSRLQSKVSNSDNRISPCFPTLSLGGELKTMNEQLDALVEAAFNGE
ncbi:hypothetical protein [Acetobacter cerevisiae]|uniref:hypothetical protein n=1 Tax=Acetobacter cerevisiae TaxID=178900 RepID=UPI00209D45EF|nr:hypothetical protein [Acetobacter cerevisiae]MCP1270936.1 hypothetical protein [Acetobacter cerevisiae]MCP1278833.1 hypothetical protein [Acetobacter cerevisiae]